MVSAQHTFIEDTIEWGQGSAGGAWPDRADGPQANFGSTVNQLCGL